MYSTSYTVPVICSEKDYYGNSICPIEAELTALDEHRARLVARLADKKLLEAAQNRSTKANLDAWKKRESRRRVEAEMGMSVPLGPWDEDLDNFHDGCEYPVDLPADLVEKGYKAYCTRNFITWTWCGYVQTPEDHPVRKLETSNYDWFSYERPEHIPSPSQEVTYHDSDRGIVGWDHAHGYDVIPYKVLTRLPNKYKAPYYEPAPKPMVYTTYAVVSAECAEMAKYLVEVAEADQKHASSSGLSIE